MAHSKCQKAQSIILSRQPRLSSQRSNACNARAAKRDYHMTHKHGRTDANHTEIVNALQAIGASVTSLADVGGGCPDLLVGYRGQNMLLEVKDGRKPPSARGLAPAEQKW